MAYYLQYLWKYYHANKKNENDCNIYEDDEIVNDEIIDDDDVDEENSTNEPITEPYKNLTNTITDQVNEIYTRRKLHPDKNDDIDLLTHVEDAYKNEHEINKAQRDIVNKMINFTNKGNNLIYPSETCINNLIEKLISAIKNDIYQHERTNGNCLNTIQLTVPNNNEKEEEDETATVYVYHLNGKDLFKGNIPNILNKNINVTMGKMKRDENDKNKFYYYVCQKEKESNNIIDDILNILQDVSPLPSTTSVPLITYCTTSTQTDKLDDDDNNNNSDDKSIQVQTLTKDKKIQVGGKRIRHRSYRKRKFISSHHIESIPSPIISISKDRKGTHDFNDKNNDNYDFNDKEVAEILASINSNY